MMRHFAAVFTLVCLLVAPVAVFAHPHIDSNLQQVYNQRGDLQAAFDASTYKAVPGSGAGFLIDLQDWAEQYGWREYPSLKQYKPDSEYLPVKKTNATPVPELTAEHYIVIDRRSRQVLAADGAGAQWPIASLTKLITADVVLDKEISFYKTHNLLASDDVGGAKLWVNSGAQISVNDLLYATLVGSANNAANALSRATNLSKAQFMSEMNKRADWFNLSHTQFVDPTGIEVGNVSTAREIAQLAEYVFEERDMRRFTTTAKYDVHILSDDSYKDIKNTNWMLYKPEFDDVFVMSGKTGYLHESKWNLLVSIRPRLYDRQRELMIVTFGADSRADSARDTKRLAKWTWANFQWTER